MNFPVIDSDFSSLEGSGCYCSDSAAESIRKKLSPENLNAIHMLGSGDLHYVSLFWAELIREPFSLILMDNHPDDQPPAFGENLISCGSWIRNVRTLPLCKGTLWYDGKGAAHQTGEIAKKIHLSIDLDILDGRYFTTDWDQGTLSPENLYSMIRTVKGGHEIIGADVCGAPSASQRLTTCGENANAAVIRNLLTAINQTNFQP